MVACQRVALTVERRLNPLPTLYHLPVTLIPLNVELIRRVLPLHCSIGARFVTETLTPPIKCVGLRENSSEAEKRVPFSDLCGL